MLLQYVIISHESDTFKYMNITKSQFCCLYSRTKGKLDRKKTQAMLHVRPTKTRISSDSQSPGFTNKAVSKASQTNSSINRLLYRIINAKRNNPIRCTSYYIHIKSIYVSAYSYNKSKHSSVLTNDRTALSDGQLTRVDNNNNNLSTNSKFPYSDIIHKII